MIIVHSKSLLTIFYNLWDTVPSWPASGVNSQSANEWGEPADALLSLISVGYLLELRIAIAFYWEHDFLPE